MTTVATDVFCPQKNERGVRCGYELNHDGDCSFTYPSGGRSEERRSSVRNQCCGCQAGWPFNERGYHVTSYPKGGLEVVGCTRDRYEGEH